MLQEHVGWRRIWSYLMDTKAKRKRCVFAYPLSWITKVSVALFGEASASWEKGLPLLCASIQAKMTKVRPEQTQHPGLRGKLQSPGSRLNTFLWPPLHKTTVDKKKSGQWDRFDVNRWSSRPLEAEDERTTLHISGLCEFEELLGFSPALTVVVVKLTVVLELIKMAASLCWPEKMIHFTVELCCCVGLFFFYYCQSRCFHTLFPPQLNATDWIACIYLFICHS